MPKSPIPLPEGYPDELPAVEVREWTRETYPMAFGLKLAEGQTEFVAENTGSLAQAYFHEEARPLGLFAGELAVGFVMLSVEDVDDGVVWIWRFMIGAKHQRKGFGRQAVAAILKHARGMEGVETVKLCHVDKPGHPGPFYESLGFSYTGENEEGELVMSQSLDS
jgi:diamine N-acetyltransferase